MAKLMRSKDAVISWLSYVRLQQSLCWSLSPSPADCKEENSHAGKPHDKELQADSENQRQTSSDAQQGTEAPSPPVVRN